MSGLKWSTIGTRDIKRHDFPLIGKISCFITPAVHKGVVFVFQVLWTGETLKAGRLIEVGRLVEVQFTLSRNYSRAPLHLVSLAAVLGSSRNAFVEMRVA